MSLLTDEEIDNIEKDCWENLNTDNCITFARAIEQAVIAKRRDQAPIGYYDDDFGFNLPGFFSNQEELVKTGKLTPLYEHPAPIAPEGMVLVPIEIIDRFPQLNPSNYDHEGVCYLNAWGVELVLAAARSE